MIVIKIINRIICLISKIIYKILYGQNFSIGSRVHWRSGFKVMMAKKARIKIGRDCFFNNYCSLNSLGSISIGDGTLFGENVRVYDHNHVFRDKNKPIKDQGFKIGKVAIGKHCWICSNVTILKGTEIGDNCVIGAGVVVSGTIPDNTIVKNCNGNYVYEIMEV